MMAPTASYTTTCSLHFTFCAGESLQLASVLHFWWTGTDLTALLLSASRCAKYVLLNILPELIVAFHKWSLEEVRRGRKHLYQKPPGLQEGRACAHSAMA